MGFGSQLKAVGTGAIYGLIACAVMLAVFYFAGPFWYVVFVVVAAFSAYGIGSYLERRERAAAAPPEEKDK